MNTDAHPHPSTFFVPLINWMETVDDPPLDNGPRPRIATAVVHNTTSTGGEGAIELLGAWMGTLHHTLAAGPGRHRINGTLQPLPTSPNQEPLFLQINVPLVTSTHSPFAGLISPSLGELEALEVINNSPLEPDAAVVGGVIEGSEIPGQIFWYQLGPNRILSI